MGFPLQAHAEAGESNNIAPSHDEESHAGYSEACVDSKAWRSTSIRLVICESRCADQEGNVQLSSFQDRNDSGDNERMTRHRNADTKVGIGGRLRVFSSQTVDCIFLFAVILASALPYLGGLGFYSDDWWFQSALTHVSGDRLTAMFSALLASNSDLPARPVQAAFLLLEFKAFGRSALPYHIVCLVLLGLVTILLYLLLREARAGRLLAFLIALIFGLLPHYSTDRIWIASQQSLLCLVFAFFGIYGLLRSVRPDVRRRASWLTLGALSLILSFFSYEVALGLIVASIGALGWLQFRQFRRSPRRSLADLAGLAGAVAVLLAVGVVKAHLQSRIVIHYHLRRFLGRLGGLSAHALSQAVRFNFWTYGLHLPAVIVRLYQHSALSKSAIAMATIIALSVTAYLWQFVDGSDAPSWRSCILLTVLGFVLFGLGYLLFFLLPDTDFTSAGLSNRITIASALGASFVLVAFAGLACSMLRSQRARVRAFGFGIALISWANCLAMSGIGAYWKDAASQQAAILGSVAANVKALPRGSVLLLDGFCRYSGPGVVFETDWDATGAIRLTLGDDSLSGDVVSPNMHFDEAGAQSMMNENVEGQYPYGNRLFVYNVRQKILTSLPSKEAAAGYLRAMNPTGDSGCPTAHEGDGAKVF